MPKTVVAYYAISNFGCLKMYMWCMARCMQHATLEACSKQIGGMHNFQMLECHQRTLSGAQSKGVQLRA
jgi:hypothetical protein